MTLQIFLEPYKYLALYNTKPTTSHTKLSKRYVIYIYFNEKHWKIFISENHQIRNPTLNYIIHANKLTDNDFKAWVLCNEKSR